MPKPGVNVYFHDLVSRQWGGNIGDESRFVFREMEVCLWQPCDYKIPLNFWEGSVCVSLTQTLKIYALLCVLKSRNNKTA